MSRPSLPACLALRAHRLLSAKLGAAKSASAAVGDFRRLSLRVGIERLPGGITLCRLVEAAQQPDFLGQGGLPVAMSPPEPLEKSDCRQIKAPLLLSEYMRAKAGDAGKKIAGPSPPPFPRDGLGQASGGP